MVGKYLLFAAYLGLAACSINGTTGTFTNGGKSDGGGSV